MTCFNFGIKTRRLPVLTQIWKHNAYSAPCEPRAGWGDVISARVPLPFVSLLAGHMLVVRAVISLLDNEPLIGKQSSSIQDYKGLGSYASHHFSLD